MMMSTHWGDLPAIHDTESGIAAIEREQLTKPRPMEVEGPPLRQPSSAHFPPTNDSYPREDFAIDLVSLHTIQLLEHSRKLRSLIATIKSLPEGQSYEENGELTCPAAPVFPGREPFSRRRPQRPLQFLAHDPDSLFVRGIGRPPPEIDRCTTSKLLKRSVATICAHAGFEGSTESVLDTLTDLCSEYFIQMTGLLRHAVDGEAMFGATGFPDAITQVFYEMGIGSPTVLHDYYQSRILAYHDRLTTTCRQLQLEYERLKKPDATTSTDSQLVLGLKDDPTGNIQFPSMDDMEEASDMDQMLQLEGLGLDMSHESSNALGMETEDGITSTSGAGGGRWKGDVVVKQEQPLTAGDNRDHVGEAALHGRHGDGSKNFTSPGSIGSELLSPTSTYSSKQPSLFKHKK